MSDYGKYHCFGFDPEELEREKREYVKRKSRNQIEQEEYLEKKRQEGIKEAKEKRIHEIEQELQRHKELQQELDSLKGNIAEPFILDLSNVTEPRPTAKQLDWLNTVHAWHIVPDGEYQIAISSFKEAQKCISKYYDDAQGVRNYSHACSITRSTRPTEGERKYYADGICKYSEELGKYVDEKDYDFTHSYYGGYNAKDRYIDDLEAQERGYCF